MSSTQHYARVKPTKLAVVYANAERNSRFVKEFLMQTVTQEVFAGLFQQCIALALEETQKQVADPLPKELYLGLEAFGQRGKALSIEEVLTFLYRQGFSTRC